MLEPKEPCSHELSTAFRPGPGRYPGLQAVREAPADPRIQTRRWVHSSLTPHVLAALDALLGALSPLLSYPLNTNEAL